MSSFSTIQHHSPTLSRKMKGLGAQNSRTLRGLDKELLRLEKERKNKLRELNQETKHFLDMKLRASSARSRECSPDRCSGVSLPAYALCSGNYESRPACRSPSPNPRSPLDDLSPLSRCLSPRTQKILYKKSPSMEDCPSPKLLSPNSSPETPRKLLSKRDVEDQPRLHKSDSVTETSVTRVSYISSPRNGKDASSPDSLPFSDTSTSTNTKTRRARPSNAEIPQIIVSDTTPLLPNINLGVNQTDAKSDKESPPTEQTTATSSDKAAQDGSLHIPVRRARSKSVPTIAPPIEHLLDIAKKQSTFESTADHGASQETTAKPRGRSSSVCVPYYQHLKNAPRRESLLRKYIARPKIYHRTAKTIDQLISDVAKGISSDLQELDSRYKPITPEEWEKLKTCRYLRMPGKDEHVKGNTLDIDKIFPKPSKQK